MKTTQEPMTFPRIPILLYYPQDSDLEPQLVYLTRIPSLGEEIHQDSYSVFIVQRVGHLVLSTRRWCDAGEYVAMVQLTWKEVE